MNIEAGKCYRTRDGRKVRVVEDDGTTMPFQDDGGFWHYPDGRIHSGQDKPHDLIAEWSDPVDLTAITTPFGLLDRATQEALKAQPAGTVEQYTSCGWRPHHSHRVTVHPAIVYRVRPQPPAPTKPRTIFTCEVHGERHVHDTAMAATKQALEFQHGEATVTEWIEVTK